MRHSTKTSRWFLGALLTVLALLVLTGCGSKEQNDQAAEKADAAVGSDALTSAQAALVAKAASVANAIENAPAAAAKIMADNGLTIEEYQELIYQISADPVLARAYEEARKH